MNIVKEDIHKAVGKIFRSVLANKLGQKQYMQRENCIMTKIVRQSYCWMHQMLLIP